MTRAKNIRQWYLRGIDSELLTVRGKLLIVEGEPDSRHAWEVAKHYIDVIGGDVDDLYFHTAFRVPDCFEANDRDIIKICRNYHTMTQDGNFWRQLTTEELYKAMSSLILCLQYAAIADIDDINRMASELVYCSHLLQVRQNKARDDRRK